MQKKIRYQIKTLSPVLLSTNTGDMNMTATLDYIPGSAILGVLAGRYIQIKNLGKEAHKKDPDFYNWFLNSGVIFCNAYPCKEIEYRTATYFPIPLSIQTEKNDENSAIDLFKQDPDPEKQMKTIKGYCNIAGDTIQKLTPSKSLNFHHARPDRIKGHSVEGQIFNYESIDPDQLFEGEIIGEEETLKEFVELVGSEFPIQLGRSRTAQYGQAELKMVSEKPEELEVEDELDNEIYLTFLSPVILYNKNGFSSTSLKDLAGYLTEALGTEIKQDQIKSFKKPVEVENFISIWKLKKSSEVAFEAGSCFSIQANGWNNSKMIELQRKGIGERRGEGFGRISLGLHKKDIYRVKVEEKPDINRPDGNIPELTVRIFEAVIKDNWEKVIEGKALDEYKEFSKNKNNPPTNALLGRLEMMLKSAANKDGFLNQLAKLRDTAKNKLEACNNKKITLLDFIKSGEPDLEHAFKQKPKLLEMEREIKYEPLKDTGFCNDLYQLYWLTFFRMMRKSSKKKEGTNE